MKLLIYTHVWLPVMGGLQTVTTDLGNGFTEWGKAHPGEEVEVTIATETPAGEMRDDGLPFRVVRRPGLRALMSLIRAADVVHIANPALKPLGLALLLGRPTVIEHDGNHAACPNGMFLFQPDRSVCPGHFQAGRYGKCVECNTAEMGRRGSFMRVVWTFPRRWLAQRADVNIFPTAHIARRVGLNGPRVIPHGVPKYSELGAHSAGGNGARPYFGYVGRLANEKGVAVLLNACAKLAAEGQVFGVKIVGDGYERPLLEKLARDLQIDSRIEFLGAFPVSDVQRSLGDPLAVIMPSICEDVAPLAAYEQLMHGRLVIASDIGGLGEIVDGVSLKFPAGDAEALAACMRRALSEPALVSDLRDRAQRRALAAYTQQRMVSEHLDVYKALLGAARGRN
ncbi:MAG TPA: glycosyltransferase [Candidatus Acidoferrales bacterium]|nr:glycosyltransferase [Candidatus Acidoferrales bacterium]